MELITSLLIFCCAIGFFLYAQKRIKCAAAKEKLTIEQAIKVYEQQIKNQIKKEETDLLTLKNEKEQLLKEKTILILELDNKKNLLQNYKEEQERITATQQELNNTKLKIAYEQKEKELNLLYQKQKTEIDNEIYTLKLNLNDYKQRQAAINEQIWRESQLEEQQNLHRINLKEKDKNDIHYLVSIEENINNKELLHKLIWTEYLQRPFNEMFKSFLGNTSPKNVIYCIENINTHKKYIGKTRGEYKDRQINHIKASLSIGTLSHQKIHEALFKHWDEFMFYIIEEVQDEQKLSEREKYYISFYETDKYGYNLKVG